MNRIAEISVQIIVSIIIVAAMLEVLLHAFPGFLPSQTKTLQQMVNDDYLGSKMPDGIDDVRTTLDGKTFHVKTISLGFPGIGFRDDGINGSAYAVVLGDSFAYGYGVEAPNISSEIMENSTGKNFVNMGVPGYSTTQEYRLYERYGSKLKPNVTILYMFENDFLDNLIFEGTNTTSSGNNWLQENSAIYKILKFVKNYYLENRNFQTYTAFGRSYTFDPAFYKKSLFEGKEGHVLDLAASSLSGIKRIADPENTTFIVIFIPYREHLYQSYITNSSQYDFDFGVRSFTSLCSRLSLNCIDMSDTFAGEIDAGNEVYLRPLDGHINELGNRLIADRVLSYISNGS